MWGFVNHINCSCNTCVHVIKQVFLGAHMFCSSNVHNPWSDYGRNRVCHSYCLIVGGYIANMGCNMYCVMFIDGFHCGEFHTPCYFIKIFFIVFFLFFINIMGTMLFKLVNFMGGSYAFVGLISFSLISLKNYVLLILVSRSWILWLMNLLLLLMWWI